jgi:hypothetical protein
MRAVSFLARFVLISGCLFLVWFKMHHWYMRLVDQVMLLGFSLAGWRLIIPQDVAVYYETFNIVTFASLVLATQGVRPPRRIGGLAAGLGALFLLHLGHRIDNLLITGFSFAPVVRFDYVLGAIAQYVMPVLLWLVVVRGFPGRQAKPNLVACADSP